MKRRSGIKIVMQLIGLVKPMWLIMTGAVIVGVIGYLCATFITILGGYGLLGVLGVQTKMSLHTVLSLWQRLRFFEERSAMGNRRVTITLHFVFWL